MDAKSLSGYKMESRTHMYVQFNLCQNVTECQKKNFDIKNLSRLFTMFFGKKSFVVKKCVEFC